MRLSYAVVRDDPPQVLAAENLDVLHRALGLKVVAATSPVGLAPGVVDAMRAALLEERWADAVIMWMGCTGLAVDVYDDLDVLTEAELDADFTSVRLQFTPLFNDPG